jgi:SAM-dependent methyltransferase
MQGILKRQVQRIVRMRNVIRVQRSIPIGQRVGQLRTFATAANEKDFFSRNCHSFPKHRPSKTLDLGCGASPKNPFEADIVQGIDIRENQEQGIVRADLCSGHIPFPDNSFDFITAFDLIEHIPRVLYIDNKSIFPFIDLMSEICRVLKNDGIFYSHTPAYPYKQAFQDPTHVNIITEETFPFYFCSNSPFASVYGFKGNFELIAQEWDYYELLTLMKKVPERK